MVQIKLSVVFILAAAAIAPVVAQPFSVEHPESSQTGVDARVSGAKSQPHTEGHVVELHGQGRYLGSHSALKDLLSRLHLDKSYEAHNHNEGSKFPTRVAAHIHLPRDNSEMVKRSFDDFDFEARYYAPHRRVGFRSVSRVLRGGGGGPQRGGPNKGFAPGVAPIAQRARFGRSVLNHRGNQPFPTTD